MKTDTLEGKTVFAADMHLRPGTQPAQNEMLRAFLHRIRGARQLVLLGDAWNGWYERRGRVVGDYAEALSLFAAASAAGLPIHHISGNRDFVVGPDGERGARLYRGFHWPMEDRQPSLMVRHGIRPHGSTYAFSEQGRRIHCAHGDQFCTRDYMHILFVRHGLMGRLGRVYSIFFPYWLTNLVIGHAQKTQLLPHYGVIPYASSIQASAVARVVDAGADHVVCGHLHVHEERRIEGAARRGVLTVVPKWMDAGACGVFEGDHIRIAHVAE